MKKIILGVLLVIGVGLVIVGTHYFWPSHSSTIAVDEIPISIEPLPFGVNETEDSAKLFEQLVSSGIFTYYIDRATGTKIDISGLNVRVVGNRSTLVPVVIENLELTLWKVSRPDGTFKLSSNFDAAIQAAKKQKVVLKISGKMTPITPVYEWVIDPEYYRSPHGVIQDLYIVSAGSVEISTIDEIKTSSNGSLGKITLEGHDKEEISSIFRSQFKNAVIGRWQTNLDDIVERQELDIALAPLAIADIYLMGRSASKDRAMLQLQITKVMQGSVSFRFGAQEFSDVPIGHYRSLNNDVILQLAGIEPPAKAGAAPTLKVIIHYIDQRRGENLGISVRFKQREDGQSSFIQEARRASELNRAKTMMYDSIVQYVDIEKEPTNRLRYIVRNVYTVRALRDFSEKECDFEEWTNGNFDFYERWPGSEQEVEEGNIGKKYRIRFSMHEGEVKAIVTGWSWIYKLPFTRRSPDGAMLGHNEDYISYPSEDDYIANLKIVITSSSLKGLRAFAHKPSSGDAKEGRDPGSQPNEQTLEVGGAAEPEKTGNLNTTLSTEWNLIRPHERLSTYFRWE